MLDSIYKIKEGWKSCISRIFLDMDNKGILCENYTILIPEKVYNEIQSDKYMHKGRTKEVLETVNNWTKNVFEVAFKIDPELEDEMKVVINE